MRMYDSIRELILHEPVVRFERIGQSFLLFAEGRGFLACDTDLNITWETACDAEPFAIYIDEGRAVVLFDGGGYGLLDLRTGRLIHGRRESPFSDAWFCQLYRFEGDRLFLYSAETDIAVLDLVTGKFSYADYEQAPEFGRLIERAYDEHLVFERFIAPSTVVSYDPERSGYVVFELGRPERFTPFPEYDETMLVDLYGSAMTVVDDKTFQLFENGKPVFCFDGCATSILLKSILLDDKGRRVMILSESLTFQTTWIQLFEAV